MADNAENVDTSTIGNVNSVRADLTQQEYLFKLVPDFGVFDIAEKYFIDGNLINSDPPIFEQQLFFYKITTNDICNEDGSIKTSGDKTIKTTFRRAIFKFDKNFTIGSIDSSTFQYKFNDRYLILINELSPISFTINEGDVKVIGVCF